MQGHSKKSRGNDDSTHGSDAEDMDEADDNEEEEEPHYQSWVFACCCGEYVTSE